MSAEPKEPAEPTEITRVAPGLWRVPLTTPTLPPAKRTNAYVWDRGGRLWIVDPGPSSRRELSRLTELLDSGGSWPGLAAGELGGYVITHHHPDHWGGLKRLLAWRQAPVVAAAPERYALLDASFRPPDWLHEAVGYEALLPTPGHSRDHLVVLTSPGSEPPMDVLAGDLVAGVGTVVINPPDGDMADYLASLERLSSLGVGRIFPAHGPTIDDGPGLVREYIAHRLMRERQVIEALGARQPATPSGLVPSIYPDLALVLRPVAARSVLAHLLKLEREGRVERVGRKWRLV